MTWPGADHWALDGQGLDKAWGAEGGGDSTGPLQSEQQPQGPELEPEHEGHLGGGVALGQVSASLRVITHPPWGSWETK